MDKFKQTALEFVLTEIQVGLTFVSLAQRTDASESEKIQREVTNARKAYESALKFQNKIGFTDEERDHIEQRIKVLRAALEKLDQQA